MRTRWSKEEIESVLIQLNNQFYPFEKYRFTIKENSLVLLGTGGYANVYEMEYVAKPKERFAVKVLGFGEKHVDSGEFRKAVEIQKDLGYLQNDVVKIFDYIELRVSIDLDGNVFRVGKVSENKEIPMSGDYLHLQFILMEKLTPVLEMDKAGKPRLFPESLANFEETEIIKFAHNIGVALTRAHAMNLLHRDIKLENVFYDSKKKVYKLGDFGIAKMTDDGMASTVAFTRGYGAPEVVGAIDERYDNTADIYSFGMMLYLLLNELKFPDSENYNVNIHVQYSKGYVLPYPKRAEGKLCEILCRMCKYDPDERYQSMETVVNDLEGLLLGEDIRFKKEKQKATYVLAIICYLLGVVMWKLTHIPDLSLDIGSGGYVFLIAGGYEYYLNLKKKKHGFLSFILLGLGVYILVSSRFSWWRLLLILGIAFSKESFAGLAVGGVMIIDLLSKVMRYYPEIYISMAKNNWVALLLLSFSLILYIQYSVLKERDLKTNSMYFRKNGYWVFVIALYGALLFVGLKYRYSEMQNPWNIPFIDMVKGFVDKYNLILLGLRGIGLSIVWSVRENVLRRLKNGTQ